MSGDIYTVFSLTQDESAQMAFINRALAMLEFDYFDYVQRFPVPFTSPRYQHLGTIPDALIRVGDYHLIHDTVIPLLMQRESIQIWERKDFYASHPDLAQQTGENFYGLVAPCSNLLGNTRATLTLIRLNRPISAQEFASDRTACGLLVYALLHTCQMILSRRHRQQEGWDLSRRQVEILNWIADGKSNDDIALILGISTHTVNYHIQQILDKTGTQNRHNAAMSALAAGVIPA